MSGKQPWLDRDEHIKKELEELECKGVDHKTELARRLKRLASRKHCPDQATAWVKSESCDGRRAEILLSGNANAKVGSHPAIALSKLKHLQDEALLTFSVLLESTSRLLSYSVGLQGKGRTTGAGWYARIDLTQSPEGKGPCGHPLLHCHVGTDSKSQGEPEVRAPLPFLTPAEALDWLLATADPALEP